MPSRFSGNPDHRRALDAFIKLRRAADAVDRRLDAVLAAEGLAGTRFGVLEALHHLGPLTLTELGRKLLKSESNLCATVDRLEAEGLVTRQRRNDDRRVVDIALTEAGRARIAALFPAHAERAAALFSALTPAEIDTLAALAKRVGLFAQGGGDDATT